MSTLLLRLAGPMQAWGTDSRFDIRFTGREPSKSGVVGLLCAALGRGREQPLTDLAALRMGVRIDRPGRVGMDYQTAGGTHLRGDSYGVVNASGKGRTTVQSWRYYLADATFLVGLESEDDALLHRLNDALAAPRWQICLGRKAFLPGVPVRLPDTPPVGPGVRPGGLEDALSSAPWLPDGVPDEARPRESMPDQVRLLLETGPAQDAEQRMDVPLSFAKRRFTVRYVRSEFVSLPRGGV